MAGFPCVSLSMLTSTPGSVLSADCESGRGYLGMEDYIGRHKPRMVLLENVATLYAKREAEHGESAFLAYHYFFKDNLAQFLVSKNVASGQAWALIFAKMDPYFTVTTVSFIPTLRYSLIKKRLEDMGYQVSGGLHNTADFGLPQQRRRAWVLCHLASEVSCSPEALTSDVNRFRRCYVQLSKCLDLTVEDNGRPSKKTKCFDKNRSKWLKGFQEQCDVFGKAGVPLYKFDKSIYLPPELWKGLNLGWLVSSIKDCSKASQRQESSNASRCQSKRPR